MRSPNSKSDPEDSLAGARNSAGSADGRDCSISAGIHAIHKRWGRENIACYGLRQEEPVEDVLKLHAELRVESLLPTKREVSGETHRFRWLPLPAVVVVKRSGNAPLSRARIRPGGGIEYDRGLWV